VKPSRNDDAGAVNVKLPPPNELRVVFFDAAGTLFHLPQGVGPHYREVLLRHGVDRKADALEAAFRTVWAEIEPPATSAGPRTDDDRSWWRAVVERVLDGCEVAPEHLERGPFFDELYAEFTRPAVWRLYPETAEVLDKLSARFVLGVITNFDGRFRVVAEQLGIARHFQHVVISSEVGADKPDPRIFTRALEIAGVDASAAMHAGDDPACDWEGAAAAGLHVFRLERPRNSLRELLALLRPK
jgi:putative hydrolase of the HAD superfamily